MAEMVIGREDEPGFIKKEGGRTHNLELRT